MKLDYLSKNYSVLKLLESILLLVLVLGNYVRLYLFIPICVIIILALINVSEYQINLRNKDLVAKSSLWAALHKCVLAVEKYQGREGMKTLRANIMIPKEKNLKIVAMYRMDKDPDRNITFGIGQGCCGDAFDSGSVVVGDTEAIYKDTWEETKLEGRPWGISEEQYNMTRGLKSVLSIPLTVKKDKIIGVLNFDDKISLTDSKFKDDSLLEIIGGYEYLIKQILTGRV